MNIKNLFAQSTKHLYNVKWNQIGGETTIKVDGSFYEVNWFNNKNIALYKQDTLLKVINADFPIKIWIVERPSSVLDAVCKYKGFQGGVLAQLLTELTEMDKLMISGDIAHLPENAAGVKQIRNYKL